MKSERGSPVLLYSLIEAMKMFCPRFLKTIKDVAGSIIPVVKTITTKSIIPAFTTLLNLVYFMGHPLYAVKQ